MARTYDMVGSNLMARRCFGSSRITRLRIVSFGGDLDINPDVHKHVNDVVVLPNVAFHSVKEVPYVLIGIPRLALDGLKSGDLARFRISDRLVKSQIYSFRSARIVIEVVKLSLARNLSMGVVSRMARRRITGGTSSLAEIPQPAQRPEIIRTGWGYGGLVFVVDS